MLAVMLFVDLTAFQMHTHKLTHRFKMDVVLDMLKTIEVQKEEIEVFVWPVRIFLNFTSS